MGLLGEISAGVNIFEKILNLFKKCLKKYDKNRSENFYYKEFDKKLFIDKDGNGVLISSFVLKAFNPQETKYIVRDLDIHDGKKSARFDSLDKMQKTSKTDIFNQVGFWFFSPQGIVTDVEEYYDDMEQSRKDDPQFISFKLNLNTSKMKSGGVYNFSYAFSIPGMFSILDGRFDNTNWSRTEHPGFKSLVSARNFGDRLRFAIYFSNYIEFRESPYVYKKESRIIPAKEKSKKSKGDSRCISESGIFYTKYWFEVEEPQKYNCIGIKWDVKDRH